MMIIAETLSSDKNLTDSAGKTVFIKQLLNTFYIMVLVSNIIYSFNPLLWKQFKYEVGLEINLKYLIHSLTHQELWRIFILTLNININQRIYYRFNNEFDAIIRAPEMIVTHHFLYAVYEPTKQNKYPTLQYS